MKRVVYLIMTSYVEQRARRLHSLVSVAQAFGSIQVWNNWGSSKMVVSEVLLTR